MFKKRATNKMLLAFMLSASWLSFSSNVLAASNEAVEQRLQQYEQRIKSLEDQLQTSGLGHKDVSTLKRSTKRLSKKLSSLSDQLDETINRFSINGFFSAGVVTSDSTAEFAGKQIADDPQYEADSILGLQFQFKINEDTDLVTQLVARGVDDYNIESQWAYLRHHLNDSFTIRAGRMRIPFFMLSEFQDVGYALPWARAPQEVYGAAPFDNYQGFDLTWNYEIAELTGDISTYTGRATETNSPISDLNINDIVGINASINYGDLTLRIGTTRGRITSNTLAGVGGMLGMMGFNNSFARQKRGDFSGISLRYDNGTWLGMAEVVRNRRHGMLSDTEANYVMGGYRIDSFTPYVSFANRYTVDDTDRANAIAGANTLLADADPTNDANATMLLGLLSNPRVGTLKQKSWTFGLRHEINTGLSIKGEFQHFYDFKSTFGQFESDPGDNVDFYTIVIDSVF